MHARRSLAGLQALLGQAIVGIVISDRWKVYEVLRDGRRQLCWAHLIRDFRALSERRGTSRLNGYPTTNGLTNPSPQECFPVSFHPGHIRRSSSTTEPSAAPRCGVGINSCVFRFAQELIVVCPSGDLPPAPALRESA